MKPLNVTSSVVTTIFLLKYSLIVSYLKSMTERRKREEREREFPFAALVPHVLNSQSWVRQNLGTPSEFPVWVAEAKHWDHLPLLSQVLQQADGPKVEQPTPQASLQPYGSLCPPRYHIFVSFHLWFSPSFPIWMVGDRGKGIWVMGLQGERMCGIWPKGQQVDVLWLSSVTREVHPEVLGILLLSDAVKSSTKIDWVCLFPRWKPGKFHI